MDVRAPVGLALGLLFLSCGSDRLEGDGDLQGYQHDLQRSRFAIGTVTGTAEVTTFREITGTEGAFSTEISSGMTIGTQNMGSPALAVGGFAADADAHNAVVFAYFTGAGLPGPQVADVQAISGFWSHISATSPDPTSHVDAVWITSILCRSNRGVKVSDSFAWATFNASGQTVSEAVYWPTIPSAALQATAAFQTMLASAESRDAYFARLPPGADTGSVVLHHSSGEDATFWAHPYYDVFLNGVTLHFDPNGSAETVASSDTPCH